MEVYPKKAILSMCRNMMQQSELCVDHSDIKTKNCFKHRAEPFQSGLKPFKVIKTHSVAESS